MKGFPMKALVLALVLSLTSTFAMAREPKATQFSDAAKNSVVSLFGKKGDKVNLKLVEMTNDEESSTEVWEVILSNGADKGSAIYEATITAQDNGPGGEVANIKIRYIDGN
jgi:hypothetical protein